jgi:hypothetical protein
LWGQPIHVASCLSHSAGMENPRADGEIFSFEVPTNR